MKEGLGEGGSGVPFSEGYIYFFFFHEKGLIKASSVKRGLIFLRA